MNAPKIIDDFKAAGGTDLRFCIGPEGVWLPEDVTDYPAEQWAILQAVLAEHDPARAEVDAARAAINARRNELEFGVFTDSLGHRYDVDRDSRDRLTGAVTMATAVPSAIPAGFEWTDADNVQRPHTAATLIALAGEILAWTSAVHAHAVGLKAAVERGENPNIETGWPGQQ